MNRKSITKTKMKNKKNIKVIINDINLPLTKLHYAKCGSGPVLIIVPATMSHIEDWIGLVQFMGQKFTTYFFELSGYGSTSFKENFSSKLVAKTIRAFADKLKIDSFSIMGFSFGGILTLKAVDYLKDRIDKVILLSPCVSKRAIQFSRRRLAIARLIALLFRNNFIRKLVFKFIHNKRFGKYFVLFIRKFGKVEKTIPIEKILMKMPKYSLDVLAYQTNEVLNFEISSLNVPFNKDCYFAMSVNDPILNFNKTEKIIRKNFKSCFVFKLYYSYHQMPENPTVDGLNKEYGRLLKYF